MTGDEQLDLFADHLDIVELVEPDYEADLSIAERFAIFHETNPHVATNLERLAARWLATHRRLGIGMLFEALRWESGIATEGDAYRLNNNFRSHYARLLIDRHPEWADAFETRALRAA